MSDAGIETYSVPAKFFVPWANYASAEDSDELVEWWASLLANAACGYNSSYAQFSQAMAMLSPTEARILYRMYQRAIDSNAINYYRDGDYATVVKPPRPIDGISFESDDAIRDTHSMKSVDELRVDTFGQLFVRDRLTYKSPQGKEVTRGILLPDAEYDLVGAMDGVQTLGLINHYVEGRSIQQNKTYHVWFCHLKRTGVKFLDAVTRQPQPRTSGAASE